MTPVKPVVRHYLQFNDFSREEYAYLFGRTRWIKAQFKAYQRYWPLSDRTLVMIFEKASTRTRLSFEAGIQQLGGSAIYLNTRDSQLGRGEPIEDAARFLVEPVLELLTLDSWLLLAEEGGFKRIRLVSLLPSALSAPCPRIS